MNMPLHITQIDTAVGPITAIVSPVGAWRICFDTLENVLTALPPGYPAVPLPLAQSAAALQLMEYFQGERQAFTLPLDLGGTPFQLRVWSALRQIPYGQTVSYKAIAEAAGCPRGFRAVGSANGANPLPIIIPCHRVITSDNRLGGYTSGLDRKTALLKLEGCVLPKS